jgi:hypothetical protein
MARAVALRDDLLPASNNDASTLDDVVTRYRHLREISTQHHSGILKLVSPDALLRVARRLGLARGKTLILEDIDERTYVYDLAVYTAQAGRSRAIDRYARSVQFGAQSDEMLVLQAMRAARFSILHIERRHETAGLIAQDLFRRSQVWLVDIGLESSMAGGEIIVTRLFTPDQFSMTAGVIVPFEVEELEDVCDLLPRRVGDTQIDMAIDDRRFAEAVYALALASGVTDRVGYLDVLDGD